ncbi:MAG: Hpt domain-containing protein [Desulfobacteraceae bacterium]|nr:Hpt domain-containing protein [Desulfobacteraceae bacterium]
MDFKAMASNLGIGEEDFLELTELLVTTSFSDLAVLEEGLAQGSREPVAHAAHSIKGAAGNLGFADIAAIASEVETLAGQGRFDPINAKADALRQGLDAINMAMDRR